MPPGILLYCEENEAEEAAMYDSFKNMDAREIELPDTVFIRDIETRVFQGIVVQALAKISGIGLLEGNLFDSLLGREIESVKGIHVEQDQKKHSVDIRVEINIAYGVAIPEKAEEIQTCLVEEISDGRDSMWPQSMLFSKTSSIFPEASSESDQPEGTAQEAGEFEEAF